MDIDVVSRYCNHASMYFGKTLSLVGFGLGLGLVVSACTGAPPEVPSNVTTMAARHDHEGTEVQLTLDKGELLACLGTSHSLPMGEGRSKCRLADGDYTVNLNGGATVITVFTSKKFTIDHQGFFTNECLYPMLFKAAHAKDPTPGGC